MGTIIFRLILPPAIVGFCLEYLACRVKGLGVFLPAAAGIGILAFLEYDKRHAEAMLANGQIPEALGMAVGLSILGGLLGGMILGLLVYRGKNKRDR